MSPVKPAKSPDFSSEIPADRKFRLVIPARCAPVTSSAEVIPETAATIASRTCGVRSLTGSEVAAKSVSATSMTLTITVMVSVRLPSDTVTATV